ncbi:hypothetical protein D3C72_511870 [compost metagenome]
MGQCAPPILDAVYCRIILQTGIPIGVDAVSPAAGNMICSRTDALRKYGSPRKKPGTAGFSSNLIWV